MKKHSLYPPSPLPLLTPGLNLLTAIQNMDGVRYKWLQISTGAAH